MFHRFRVRLFPNLMGEAFWNPESSSDRALLSRLNFKPTPGFGTGIMWAGVCVSPLTNVSGRSSLIVTIDSGTFANSSDPL